MRRGGIGAVEGEDIDEWEELFERTDPGVGDDGFVRVGRFRGPSSGRGCGGEDEDLAIESVVEHPGCFSCCITHPDQSDSLAIQTGSEGGDRRDGFTGS